MTTENRDGYLKIGNKTIDDLIDNKKISYKMRAYLLTVRMINGWDNESLNIPVSTYSNRLGTDERYAKRLLKELVEEGLIHRNGSLTTIPGDYQQWGWSNQNLPNGGGGKILPKGGYKVTTETVVQSYHSKHSNTPSKHTKRFASQLSREEIDKLEGPEWFRAIMIHDGGFDFNFIDNLIKTYPYSVLCDSWYEYIEASNIRNKTSFFYSLVQKYQENKD